MFFPEGQVRVFHYGEPVSMRLSFDRLFALARHRLQQNPLSGNLFAFINRRATQIKVLYFDRTGLCVCTKRLKHTRPFADRFFAWNDRQFEAQEFSERPVSGRAGVHTGGRAGLEVYLNDPDVTIDTNHLERACRVIPMGRRNWLFAWTELGAKQH